MVKSLLSADGAREIEEAVRELEKRSATELVVALLPRSGDYLQWRALASAASGLAGAIGIHLLVPSLSALWLAPLQSLLTLGAYLLTGWPPLYRGLIPPDAATQSAEQRAFAVFSENGLHQTRDRTGLLIFVSELEHRVVILADSGLHARAGEADFSEQVSALVARIREGKTKQGILEVIQHFQPLLIELAPVRPDDVNELPDSVVRG